MNGKIKFYRGLYSFLSKSFFLQARPLLDERNYKKLIDPRIVDSLDVRQFNWMVRVSEECLSKDPKKRSSMNSVSFYHVEVNKKW